MTYNVYDALAIRDDIKRCVYLHKHFWDDDVKEMDRRVAEYIELHDNNTIVESSEDYVQSLVCILSITWHKMSKMKNYNYLFYTTLINFYKFATKEIAWNTIDDFKKDDYEIWSRKKKLVTLNSKIRND